MTRPRAGAGAAEPSVRVGISACLLGQEVRYDGGHKRDRFVADTLAPFVEFVPVCPEVEIGMGTPREAVHLVRTAAGIRLRGTRSATDHTAAMRRWATRRLAQLAQLDLCGFVLKRDSPSCGMERVRLHAESGPTARTGQGLFAAALAAAMPSLPIEEEGRLNDPVLRENWIERVFAYRRLRALFAGRWTIGSLVEFHTAHTLQLLAHAPPAYAALGRLVAAGHGHARHALRARYEQDFMAALATPATPRRHVNVLQHMAGYFRAQLDAESRQELHALIEDYREGLVPLVVPLTLVRHHVRRCGIGYLQGQRYLDPHPKELMLRNHV